MMGDQARSAEAESHEQELHNICEEISEQLCKKILHKDDVSRSFIPDDAIHEVWMRDTKGLSSSWWNRFAGTQTWIVKAQDHLTIYGEYKRIFSILMMSGWSSWDQFVELFHPFDSEREKISDENLPLASGTIKDLIGSERHSRRFATEQSLFQATIVKWGEDFELDRRERLPFIAMTMRRRQGAFANVHDVTIAGYHYQGKEQREVQSSPKEVVVKCPHKKQNFSDERDFLFSIRNSTMQSSHIMSNIGTIVHRKIIHQHRTEHDFSDFYILYEKAEMDLEEFMYGPCLFEGFSDRERFPDPDRYAMSSTEIMWQARGLAEAVHFIHQEITLPNQRHEECAHHDLKLDNILVRDMNNRLTFMISDFGISKKHDFTNERPSIRQTASRLAVEQRASSRTPSDFRAAGRFTAPETPHHGEHLSSALFVQKFDIFALGCILTYLLAYASAGKTCSRECKLCSEVAYPEDVSRRHELCGPRIVKSLESALLSEGNDGWFHNSRTRAAKSSLTKWLQRLGDSSRDASESWVRRTVGLILETLESDQTRRPEANAVKRKLEDIAALMPTVETHRRPSRVALETRVVASTQLASLPRNTLAESKNGNEDAERSVLQASSPLKSGKDPAGTLSPQPENKHGRTPSIVLHEADTQVVHTTKDRIKDAAPAMSSPMTRSSFSGATDKMPSSKGGKQSVLNDGLDKVSFPALTFRTLETDEDEPTRFVKFLKHTKAEENCKVSPCGQYVVFWSGSAAVTHRIPSFGDNKWRERLTATAGDEIGDRSTMVEWNKRQFTISQVSFNFPWMVVLLKQRNSFQYEVRKVFDNGYSVHCCTQFGDLSRLNYIKVCTTGLIMMRYRHRIGLARIVESGTTCRVQQIGDLEVTDRIDKIAHSRDGTLLCAWVRTPSHDVWHVWDATTLAPVWVPTPMSPLPDQVETRLSGEKRLLALEKSFIAMEGMSADIKSGQSDLLSQKQSLHFRDVTAAAISPGMTALIALKSDRRIITAPVGMNDSRLTLGDPYESESTVRSFPRSSVGEMALATAEDSRGKVYGIVAHPLGFLAKVCIGKNSRNLTE